MNAEIQIQKTRAFDIEVKRLRVPAIVRTRCPVCGRELEKDLRGDGYLSYPTANRPFDVKLYCDGLDPFVPSDESKLHPNTEIPVRVVLRVYLEFAEAEGDAP
jgi:hypothetical protein